MNKTIAIIVAIILVGAGTFMALTKSDNKEIVSETPKVTEIHQAWIEITAGSAFLKTGGQGVELRSGDTLEKSVSVETGRTGLAIIHFPDGSVLRMDKETSVTLNDVYFKTDDHTLVVKIGLTVGRVWSKVVELATPASSWEVKSANTVATVRGTAFGMGYKNGQSWILGSEHTIAVAPIDPISKEKIANAEVVLDVDKLIQIGDKEIKLATSATTTGALNSKVVDITINFKNDIWIQSSKREDVKIDLKIEEIRSTLGDENKVREELIQSAKEAQEKLQPTGNEEKVSRPTVEVKDSQITLPSTAPHAGGSTSVASSGKVTAIKIAADGKTDGVASGTSIKFKAVASYEGGQTSDVSSTVDWRVLGSIGGIGATGVFVARLGEDLGEVPEGVGYIVATYQDLIGKSTLVRVKAPALEAPIDIGGQ